MSEKLSTGLELKKASLEAKLVRLTAGTVGKEFPSDDRKQEAIGRCQAQIREVNTALNPVSIAPSTSTTP